MTKYTHISSEAEFALLLSKGFFCKHIGDPWVRFRVMIKKYGADSCVELHDYLTYANREFYERNENYEYVELAEVKR